MELNSSNIEEIFRHFASPHDENEYNEARRLRKNVISDRTNIFLLIKILSTCALESQMQMFVIDIVNDIVEQHFKKLPLYEIASLLYQVPKNLISDEALENAVGHLIALIDLIVYYQEGKNIFLRIPEDPSEITSLQWMTYINFIDLLQNPPIFINAIPNQIDIFKDIFLIQFLQLALSMVTTHPEHSIRLISECLMFLLFSNKKKKLSIIDEVSKSILGMFQDKSLFLFFEENLFSFSSLINSDILNIFSSLLNMIPISHIEIFSDLVLNISNYCVQLLQNSFLLIQADNYFMKFGYFLSSFRREAEIINLLGEFSSAFILFLNDLLTNDFIMANKILPSTTSFLYDIYEFIPKSSHVYFVYSSFFEIYFIYGMKAIEIHANKIGELLFFGYNELKTSKKVIISLFQNSESKQDQILKMLLEAVSDLLKSDFSMVIDVKISFLIFTIHVMIKYDFCDKNQIILSRLIALVFELFTRNNNLIEIHKKLVFPNQFYSEKITIIFLTSFIKKFVNNTTSIDTSPVFILENFDNFQSTLLFIFYRFWENALLENHLEIVSKSLMLCFEAPKIFEAIIVSDFSINLYKDYLSYPCKDIIYITIAKIMIAQVSQIKFFSKLFNDLFGREDKISVKIIFNILSAFFVSSQKVEEWRICYSFYSNQIIKMCENISKDEQLIKYMLELIISIIRSAPLNSFYSYEPDSFSFFRSAVQLLINATITIGLKYSKDSDDNFSSQKSINKFWSLLSLIAKTSADLLKSPFPNFGILELYNDVCIFNLYDQIISVMPTSYFVSVQSYPGAMENILEFLGILMLHFKIDILNNKKFWDFFHNFTVLSLTSLSEDLTKLSCQTLSLLLEGSVDDTIIYRNFFVLTLNSVVSKVKCNLALKYMVDFYRFDSDFVLKLGNIIESELDEEKKADFRENFIKIWKIADKQEEFTNQEFFNLFYDEIQYINIEFKEMHCLSQCFILKG